MTQVGEREDLLEGSSRASSRTHAGIHSHSASKWQSSVSVSRRAGPPHPGQVRLDELRQLGQRIAGAGGVDVRGQHHRKLLARHRHDPAALAVDDRDRRAPRALPRDREVGRPVADGRASLRRRAAPRVHVAVVGPSRDRALATGVAGIAPARELLGEVDAQTPRDDLVGAVVRGNAEDRGRPKRESTSGDTSTGSSSTGRADDRAPRVDHRDRLGLAGAALPAA